MFNGMLKSDDVEVYELSEYSRIKLSDQCRSNVVVFGVGGGGINNYVELPTIAHVGKEISITSLQFNSPTGKGTVYATCNIQHSNTNLFTLRQGTVSFMYVGQQLNGLTATDKAKSGWIILGGVQGDTAITGYAGSVAIGSGAYAGGNSGIAVGRSSTAGQSGVAIGDATTIGASGIAIGNSASGGQGISIGMSSYSVQSNSVALGGSANSLTHKIALKANAQFSAAGDAQAGKFILMRQTIDATPLPISATNGGATTANILILPNNGTYAFKGIVVAKDAATGDSAMWEVTALMKRGANASTTALVGTPTITKVFNDAGAATWTIALTADTTLGGGVITVTGEAAKTIRWVSNIDSAEVI